MRAGEWWWMPNGDQTWKYFLETENQLHTDVQISIQ